MNIKHLSSKHLDIVLEYHNSTCLLIICIPAEEIDFEISHFCNFQTSLTLDRVIQHTVIYHSSTSIDIPNLVEIGNWTDGWTFIRSI